MANFDKSLEDIIRGDELGFKPEKAIQKRLSCHISLIVCSGARLNSILPGFRSFNLLNISGGWKLGLLSILFITMLTYNQIQSNNSLIIHTDSLCITQPLDTIASSVSIDSITVY